MKARNRFRHMIWDPENHEVVSASGFFTCLRQELSAIPRTFFCMKFGLLSVNYHYAHTEENSIVLRKFTLRFKIFWAYFFFCVHVFFILEVLPLKHLNNMGFLSGTCMCFIEGINYFQHFQETERKQFERKLTGKVSFSLTNEEFLKF